MTNSDKSHRSTYWILWAVRPTVLPPPSSVEWSRLNATRTIYCQQMYWKTTFGQVIAARKNAMREIVTAFCSESLMNIKKMATTLSSLRGSTGEGGWNG